MLLEPPGTRSGWPDLAWKHRRQLHYNPKQLAIGTRRDHHEISTRWPALAFTLHLGGDGHRSGRSPHLPRHQADQLGHHRQLWVDTTRSLLLCAAAGLQSSALVPDGCAGRTGRTCTHTPRRMRWKANADDRAGPVASQEVIKMLGTNGGGFFNANSAHPFENPTPWTNLSKCS